jgi:hypothetical protein
MKKFDEDEYVMKEEIEIDYLPNQIEEEEDEDLFNITDDMLDPSNPKLTYKAEEDDAEDNIIPASVHHKFAGIPRAIRSLATFYNPNPHFKEAQNSPDFSNWWEAMCVEFRNMEHKQVW